MAKTLVDIHPPLLNAARKLTGLKKKVEIVNYALEQLVRQRELEKLVKQLQGNVSWEGSLARMRKNRHDFG